MGYWSYYPPYVSVAEKKAKAAKKLAQLKKKNPNLQPIQIEGNSIAGTWWGKSWNQNLERYADYSNRIGRGRSYVRNGMVLDLNIQPGKVEALVQGTQSKPYKITIEIDPLAQGNWEKITRECEGKFDSLPELLEGKFPRALGEIFTAQGKGLFPAPKEIKFSCSCPDWAQMCKHVAAALYGIGARLDQEPLLFFKLRKVDVNELIGKAVRQKTKTLLQKAEKRSSRVMEGTDLGEIFGIDIDDSPEFKTTPTKSGKTTAAKKTPKPVIKQPGKTKSLTAAAMVEEIIRKSRKGMDLATLSKKTGFDEKKVYNVVYRLKKLGKIKEVGEKRYKYLPSP